MGVFVEALLAVEESEGLEAVELTLGLVETEGEPEKAALLLALGDWLGDRVAEGDSEEDLDRLGEREAEALGEGAPLKLEETEGELLCVPEVLKEGDMEGLGVSVGVVDCEGERVREVVMVWLPLLAAEAEGLLGLAPPEGEALRLGERVRLGLPLGERELELQALKEGDSVLEVELEAAPLALPEPLGLCSEALLLAEGLRRGVSLAEEALEALTSPEEEADWEEERVREGLPLGVTLLLGLREEEAQGVGEVLPLALSVPSAPDCVALLVELGLGAPLREPDRHAVEVLLKLAVGQAVALTVGHREAEGEPLAELQLEALLQPLRLGLPEADREALTHPVGERVALAEALWLREAELQPEGVTEVVEERVPEEHTEAVPLRLKVETALVGMGEGEWVEQPLGEALALLARLALARGVVGLGERESETAAEGDLEEEPHLEVEGLLEGLRLPVEVLHSVTDTVPLLETVLLIEGQGESVEDLEEVLQADLLMVTVRDLEGTPEALPVLLPVPLTEGLRLPELVPVLEAESVCVVVGVGELEGLAPAESEGEVVAVTEVEAVGVSVLEGLREGVLDTVPVAEGVLLPVPLTEGVLVLVGDTEGVLVLVALLVKVGVPEREAVLEGEVVALGETVGELLPLAPPESVEVGVAVLLPVTVEEPVTVVVVE